MDGGIKIVFDQYLALFRKRYKNGRSYSDCLAKFLVLKQAVLASCLRPINQYGISERTINSTTRSAAKTTNKVIYFISVLYIVATFQFSGLFSNVVSFHLSIFTAF